MPRNLTEESTLTMFVPDLCRTVNMDYVDSGELSGLMYHKYAISGRSFDNCKLILLVKKEKGRKEIIISKLLDRITALCLTTLCVYYRRRIEENRFYFRIPMYIVDI